MVMIGEHKQTKENVEIKIVNTQIIGYKEYEGNA